MRDSYTFVRRAVAIAFDGGWRYQAWVGTLIVLVLIGINAYSRQLVDGLIVTGLSDQVSWGFYIANFTYLVGIAAAAVLVVIPVYVYENKSMRDLVLFGEWMAVAALVMCMAFVLVDLGRPDRFWHILPGIGRANFPSSILAWDVVVLLGYLALNLYLASYLLYSRYRGRAPVWWRYIPIIMLSILWAVSIHTVTAFLYMGLGGRPFWNAAILGPRFIASAFTAGPALIVITLIIVRRSTGFKVPAAATSMLRRILQVAIIINLFLLINELFAEFYTSSLHVASATYLYFGLEGFNALVPRIWMALAFDVTAMVLFVLPITRNSRWLGAACGLAVVGIWIEKGLGLIVPGFLPTPLGEMVEYAPTTHEVLITMGIWALGVLIYTILVKVSVNVMRGRLRHVAAAVEQHEVAAGV